MTLIHEELTYKIIGAAMEVYNELGSGFLESVYQEAFEIELQKQNIPYQKEERLNINYKDVTLKKHFYADFICYGKIVIELKALSKIAPQHYSQILNYLKATGHHVGLLLNFGEKTLNYKRLAL
jgi:GxxExxY protein